MTTRVAVTFTEGTHRAADPSETLARIAPLMSEMGITRTADITGLDRLGVPTWLAVRPAALMVQVSNGKGLSHAAAKVSAVMEAIEHWHAEHPSGEIREASAADLQRDGEAYVPPSELPDYRADLHLTDQRLLSWVRGELLPDGTPVWVPACAVFLIAPMLVEFSTNGLASGNRGVEATLHALYEVIERDATARLIRGGVSLPRKATRVVDLSTMPAGPLARLRDQLERAGVALVLIRVESLVPICTFWAALVDPASPFACSCVNVGYGSHLSPTIAAIRAITEAAQSRLTFIHGSREDLSPDSYELDGTHLRLRTFFARLRGELSWADLADHSSGDLAADLEAVLGGLRAAGYGRVCRIDLTDPRFAIPVVKVLVPGMDRLQH